MAASNLKVAANRRNAKKSTGPKTAEGKHRSRFNALKHGLTAKVVVVAGVEDRKTYRRILKDLVKTYRPKGAVEKCLIQELAAWRQKIERGFRIERRNFCENLEEYRYEILEAETIGRYTTSASRNFGRILKSLMELRRAERSDKRRTHDSRASNVKGPFEEDGQHPSTEGRL